MTAAARLRAVTIILALGCLAGMVFSHRAWVSTGTFGRTFPMLPFFDLLDGLARPLHVAIAGITVLILLAMVVRPERRLLHHLAVACGIILMMLDQSRVQPWLLQYLLMLLIIGMRRSDSAADDRHSLTSLRWIVAFLYLFSGLHKINAGFLTETAPKLLAPLTQHLPDRAVVTWLPYTMPLESLIGVALLVRPCRRYGVIGAIIMHGAILLLIGPFGSNYNSVVWPWNGVMIALDLSLFWFGDASDESGRPSGPARAARALAIVLAGIVPIGGILGFVDRYLSWGMYAGPPALGAVTMTTGTLHRLPADVQSHFTMIDGERHVIFILDWSFADLNIVYPEERIYRRVAVKVAEQTGHQDDVRLVIVHAPPRWSSHLTRDEMPVSEIRP